MIDEYVNKHSDYSIAYVSMGNLRYLSAMQFMTAVVGNSSSGIIETPSFKIPTINIGNRQKGRIQAKNIININCVKAELEQAFEDVKDKAYVKGLDFIINPYRNGNTTEQIIEILKNIDLDVLQTKSFYTIKYEGIN
ncbi:GDP/UDP-N,N'-diacetylbacillosamine 2-epimerase (hydrolyzing) [compost metagenome]